MRKSTPLQRALATIRGEGWTVTKAAADLWRVRQHGKVHLFTREQLIEFAGTDAN